MNGIRRTPTEPEPAVAILRLDLRLKAAEAVRRLAELQLNEAERLLRSDVYRLRKNCKRTRALLRLVRPALGDQFKPLDRGIRDMAQALSAQRDAQVILTTWHALGLSTGRHAEMQRTLELDLGTPTVTPVIDLPWAEQQLFSVRQALCGNELRIKFDDLSGQLKAGYQRARRAMKSLNVPVQTVDLHAWRKPAKYHMLQCEMWPTTSSQQATYYQSAHRLAKRLGHHHDLAVLAKAVEHSCNDADEQQIIMDTISAQQWSVYLECLALGHRCFDRPPQRWLKHSGIKPRKR